MKCWECGKTATHKRRIGTLPWWAENNTDLIQLVDDINQRCFCKECYTKHMQRMKEENDLYIKLKKRRMFESAVDMLEHQRIDIYDYQEAIKAVEEYVEEKPDKFDSSYEMIAAIVLIHERIRCKMQYKVGKYQIDILLPDLFVALEIDGERHKNRKQYDSERDMAIKKILGSGWEIVRIKTDYLEEHADRLLDAIKQICDYRAFNN